MVDAQSFLQQFVLRRHHIVVVIVRKTRMQAVTGLAGLPMPDTIREDDVIASRVEQLAWPKQFTCELRRDELLARASGSV